MNQQLLCEFKLALSGSKKIVIIPHKNPDGDALGSSLALNCFLNKKGHNSVVIAPNEYPEFLDWMPNQDKIIKFTQAPKKSIQWIEG